MAISKTAVVVVSHYNAWPTDQLIRLLDQLGAIPAGYPYTVRVVVNQAEDKLLELPERHAAVEVLYRENTGYNIGAWEHGWRQGSPADYYLFLQEECSIIRPNWLRGFLRKIDRPGVGIVGEHIALYNTTWDDFRAMEAVIPSGASPIIQAYMDCLEAWRMDRGTMADHVQSLVVCMRRQVLEAVGGFRIGISKTEAIAAEIAITKGVEAAGYRATQVGFRPFTYILHPQWQEEREFSSRWTWVARRIVSQHLGLAWWQRQRRHRRRLRSGWLASVGTDGKLR